MEEKHFSFFDGASPTYMLVNSEVAEGDVIEAFPLFAKRIGIWILTAFFIGATGYIWSTNQVPSSKIRVSRPSTTILDKSNTYKPS